MAKTTAIESTPEYEAAIKARTKIHPDAPGTQPGDLGNGHILVVDDHTQIFNGFKFYKYPSTDRYYAKVKGKNLALHVEVWMFHNGKPPKGCVVHHDHRNPDGSFDANENNIEWLRLMTTTEHTAYHFKYRVPIEKVCEMCSRTFLTKHAREMYCSEECRNKAGSLRARLKYASTHKASGIVGTVNPVDASDNPAVTPLEQRIGEHRTVIRQCPICDNLFKVDKYSGAVVCSNPDCVSKAIKMELARKKIEKEKLERNNGTVIFINNAIKARMRCLIINGVPWFVGRDVAKSLGYSNTRDALSKHVNSKDKHQVDLTNVDLTGVAKRDSYNDATFKPASPTVIINLKGLLRLANSSKMPNTDDFIDWITSVVLPKLIEMSLHMQPPTQSAAPLALPAPTSM